MWVIALSIADFKAIQGAEGFSSKKDMDVWNAKRRLKSDLEKSVNCVLDATRNEVPQKFVVIPTKNSVKCSIVAFPDEELYVGDIVYAFGEHWIVMETNKANPLQITGIVWLCNQEFSFQNGTSTIISRWGVLDSGSYSNPKEGDSQLQYINSPFKIFMPYDSDTARLYEDKRLAVDTKYDSVGNVILETYVITGVHKASKNFGNNSHLLMLACESGLYSEEKDDVLNLICDYIAPEVEETTSGFLLNCEITGREQIGLNTTRNYGVIYYASNGEVVTGITPVWSMTTNPTAGGDITMTQNSAPNEDLVSIFVSDEDALIGTVITLSATDANGDYITAEFEAEVVALG